MTISLAETERSTEQLKAFASSALSVGVESLETVGGGRNSRVYRLRTATRSYALKAYFRHSSDSRTRMETEFGSLSFLWRNGVRNVPQPLIANQDLSCAIYVWIEGRRIEAVDVSSESIDAAVSFLRALAGLRGMPEAASLPPASEANFSASAIATHVHRRLEPLLQLTDDAKLASFLNGDLVPVLRWVCEWSSCLLGDQFENEVPPEDRTLSPSDFGFHNAMQTPGNGICFFDLEYFGWDDPAKMISDFLLHPGMDLSEEMKRRFARSVAGVFDAPGLGRRVAALYPLFGLKWCLILLNEFLPDHLLRRGFAGLSPADRRRRQAEQLGKAERKLQQIKEEYEHFPYLT